MKVLRCTINSYYVCSGLKFEEIKSLEFEDVCCKDKSMIKNLQ